jgi:hypothetical protein
MSKTPLNIRSLAREHTELAIKTLADIASESESDPARVAASSALLDRGWGKATQVIAGDEEGGPVVVTWQR